MHVDLHDPGKGCVWPASCVAAAKVHGSQTGDLSSESCAAVVRQGTQFNIDQMQRTTDGISLCTPSVECAPNWAQEAAAVVDIYAVDLNLGAMGLCTGEWPQSFQGFGVQGKLHRKASHACDLRNAALVSGRSRCRGYDLGFH
jgi:hypothetical protein